MIVIYGTHTHAANENWWRHEARFRHNAIGRPTIILNRYTIWGTLIQADADVTALTVQMAALEAAYVQDGLDFLITENDGTPTQHSLQSANSLNGVRVRDFQWLDLDPRQRQSGTEYVNKRTYRIIIEAETLNTNASGIMSWEETVMAVGTGGTEFVLKPALVTSPQKQEIQQQTGFYAIQKGRAVGFLATPVSISSPIWPTEEHVRRRKILIEDPRHGVFNNTEFPISWEYHFESTSVLTGGPPAFTP